jgi:NAD(P)-dependent dehydrogenase (short-subunit alcohol dehydrogenase family)
MSRPDDRVWWITGAGRGIGRALTEAALAAGERVIATVRRPDALDDLRNNHEEDLLVEVLDVRDRATAMRVAERGVRRFGRLDVVVNNAGHGLVGTLEEVSEADARKIVDTKPVRCALGHPGGASPAPPARRRAHRPGVQRRRCRLDAGDGDVQRQQVGA